MSTLPRVPAVLVRMIPKARVPVAASLEDLRREIDTLDTRLVRLLAERREHARRIGALKRGAGLPLRDGHREAAIRARCLKLADSLGLETVLLERVLEALFREAESPPEGRE